jgi:hypothetical protein
MGKASGLPGNWIGGETIAINVQHARCVRVVAGQGGLLVEFGKDHAVALVGAEAQAVAKKFGLKLAEPGPRKPRERGGQASPQDEGSDFSSRA